MGSIISSLVQHIAPILYELAPFHHYDSFSLLVAISSANDAHHSIATSPITSYGDQIYSMHKTRSSAGFSLDIPLIMLVSSILKVFYWFGAHFGTSLLIQALLMIIVHLLCLHVALTNRPAPSTHIPFAQTSNPMGRKRPYDFWQWRPTRPYWTFLTYFTGILLIAHLLLSTTSYFIPYTDLLGSIALSIEATLPLPQLYANYSRKGCRGFRPSVIVNWVIGDTFKMWYFFTSGPGEVPLAFKACGVFQATCDLGLAAQYLYYGDGPVGVDGTGREKEVRSPVPESNGFLGAEKGVGSRGVIAETGIEMDEGKAWERPRMS